MEGMSIKGLKKHPSLIPLFISVGAGIIGCTLYVIRLAVKNPDVTWTRNNLEPNNEYANKQYKFYNPNNIDYSKLENKAPKF